MPFAKAVFRRCDGLDGGTRDGASAGPGGKPRAADELFHESLVGIGRQLTALLLVAGQLFDELIADYRLIGDRTDRLRKRIDRVTGVVDRLDAKAASIPEGTIHAVVQVTRHFEADYASRGLSVFDPNGRPQLVQELYSRAAPTPVEHIRECDCYRTDNIRGAQIFSRVPVALNKFTDDFCPVGNVQAKCRTSLSPKTHKIRPLQMAAEADFPPVDKEIHTAGADNGSDEKRSEISNEVFADKEESFPPSSDLQAVLVVNIDVTGTSFSKLCKLHEQSRSYETKDDSYSTASLGRYKKTMKRPKTISGISDLVFQEVDIDLPSLKHSGSTKVRGAHRRSLKKLSSQTLEIYAPREKRKSQKKKSGRCYEEDDSKSCNSIRHSLKSVFRLSRSKSRDLWSSAGAEEASHKSEKDSFSLRRSMSLPRSLKSSTRQSVSFGSFRSSSTEGNLNLRVLPLEQTSTNSFVGLSKLQKPVAGERLGRSLTKSLSQMRLGHSSKSNKNFGAHVRPQSMEIRADEVERNMLSLYSKSSAINASSSTTITSGSTEAHLWGKSLSVVKLRNLKHKDCKDDCQSSSGRWSGSSGLTEKQLQDSERLVVQSSSDMSFSTKDSAMCLHFNPGENERSTYQDDTSSRNNGLHSTAVNRAEDQTATVSERQCLKSSTTYLERKRGSGTESEPHQPDIVCIRRAEIDGSDNFHGKYANDAKLPFIRAAKSSSKSKTNYRSSFMLKLKNLGKSHKSESSPKVSPISPSASTTGDCISTTDETLAQSLTPCLPRARSNEIKKLAELADRMASARARTKAGVPLPPPSFSSYVSSNSPVEWDSDVKRDKPRVCQLIPVEDACRNLRSNALNLLPFELANACRQESSDCFFANNLNIPNMSNSQSSGADSACNVGPSGSVSKLDQRTAAKGQKLVELESILETSHDCEMNSPSVVRNKLVLSRSCSNEQDSSKQSFSSDVQNAAEMGLLVISSSLEGLVDEGQSTEKNGHSFSAGADDSGTEISTSESSIISVLPLSVNVESDVPVSQSDPVPATARLIISSPVANRACFVENPHKRSLCQALSPEEFAKFCTGDVTTGDSPLKNKGLFVYPEVSSTSKQSLDFLRRSSGFSVTIRERVDPSNYGRSWYDGICSEYHPDQPGVSLQSSTLPFVLPAEYSKHFSNQTSNKSSMDQIALKDNQSLKTNHDRFSISTSASVDCSRIGPNGSAVLNRPVKSTPEKKCARVVFPSVETSLPSHDSQCRPITSSSNSKHNASSQRHLSNVDVFAHKNFGGSTFVNDVPKNTYPLHNNGGTLNLKKSFFSYDAQMVKSSTLPRSYPSSSGGKREPYV